MSRFHVLAPSSTTLSDCRDEERQAETGPQIPLNGDGLCAEITRSRIGEARRSILAG